MSVVTEIRRGKGRGRVSVFLDGKLAFTLQENVAGRETLSVGQELSSTQVAALTMADHGARCYGAALRLLGYRPRSESEMRQRLARRGFDAAGVDATIARLREEGWLDDRVFAEFWRDNRETFRPRSRWLTAKELSRKGVSPEVVDAVVSEMGDEASAYRAAQGRVRALSGLDYPAFRRRLGDYLRRRGFSYEVIDRTVKQAWQEISRGSAGVPPTHVAVLPEKTTEMG